MDSPSDERLSKLFVGGINRETSSDGLRKYFEKFGELSDCIVITDSNTKESRGFGYVTFRDHRNTTDVLEMKANGKPHIIDGKESEVKRAIPRDSANEFAHQSTNKIFIGGLPEDAKENDIKEMITSNLGKPPKNIVLLMRKDDETKNRGFCFVDLQSEDDADTLFCIRKIDMNGKSVEIKKADPRGRSERGRGRGGQGGVGRGYSKPGQYSQGASDYQGGGYAAGGYMGGAYGAGYAGMGSGYGYGAGAGAAGYGAYSGYRTTPGYSYDSSYGNFGTGYGAYDGGYSRMGAYGQSGSSYGPMKGYGTNGSTGYGGGAGYRPY